MGARPPFPEFPRLQGENLLLRQVLASDAAAIVEISFYDGVAAADEADAVRMLEQIDRDYRRGESVHWGICLLGSDEIVGTCGFYRGFEGNTGEIGYVLRERYRGKGLMTAALRLVLAFGFDQLGLTRIEAYTERSNLPSVAVLERLGFEQTAGDGRRLGYSLERECRRDMGMEATA